MDIKTYYVYNETNKTNKVFYIGVTNNILRRDKQHENKLHEFGFTAKYNVNKLVYYEKFYDINKAIAREKSLKGITRQKKRDLIRAVNPKYDDLSEAWAREFRTPADAEQTTS
ncbi:MAG: GIY-YIG nuclease family protein [Clostridia bacterium]|nr:GIY-YIG nuclease family protein [Clostridia bacterium]